MQLIGGKFENGSTDRLIEVAVDEQGRLILSPTSQTTGTSAPADTSYVHQEDTPHTSGASGVLMLAMRADADEPTAGDGDYTLLKLDEAGRLKVASQPASYPLVSGSVAAVGGQVAVRVDRASNVMVAMSSVAGVTGHSCVFEGSLDSTDGVTGNWIQLQAVRSNGNTIESTTVVLAAAPNYGWELSVNGLNWLRVRAVTHTSGTAVWSIQRGTYATEPIPAAQVTGTQPVSLGQGAEDAPVAGSAVRVGGRVRNSVPMTLAPGDAADLTMTGSGALVETPYAVPEMTWQTACPAGGLLTSVATQLRAGGATRNYLTRLDLVNAHATLATEVTVLDAVTPIFRTFLPPGAVREVSFPVPLRCTQSMAINIQASVAGVLYYSASGFQAA